MKNLTNQQKRQILASSNKIGTMVSFGNHEAKILLITQTVFNEIFLKLSYNSSNGLQTIELNSDLINII
jgi:hypothetical protein